MTGIRVIVDVKVVAQKWPGESREPRKKNLSFGGCVCGVKSECDMCCNLIWCPVVTIVSRFWPGSLALCQEVSDPGHGCVAVVLYSCLVAWAGVPRFVTSERPRPRLRHFLNFGGLIDLID